ncbi:SDR family oxidoreductase [Aquirufa antheringensis]|uniref:dTDP-4-dehydrorhamnose reductase n=1 Tax=Aquirufa antheringensis TaxID=2516559 RepID=A0A4V2IVK9_9BACT|nr:NAD(P)-dependent oxidoreductase [Aquirufa antheringensis]MCE4216005.1 sugar nucleotide-binding protein [Pseudarcicella sp. GAP-15]MCZ2477298.1 NAD(P)-dependent oxidoreductase [Aquirufa antheringensis]TBH70349.1 NAD(P)-dependent oxidoreductase [Aquirufa antheringensis]TBH72055.1 NAD(P)-dependent oxidoreductase [Aquirufa antheringensis]
MKKRLLITGSNGLLGQKLVELLRKQANVDLIATARGVNRLPVTDGYTYASLDITDQEEVNAVFDQFKPEIVIHTAAMTNVDTCETDQEGCDLLNVDAVAFIIQACEKHNSYLCHLSTDFIFDGADGPYTEEGIANPISYYGESKLKAEQLLFDSTIRWSIARTVLVYGIVPDMSRSNIVLWVKKSLEEGKTIQVVTDQFRTPTLAEDLAIGCWLLAKDEVEGIFNISGSDFLTPYEMAVMTADYYGLDKSLLQKADSSTFQQTAKRPARTGFVLDKAKKVLGYAPRTFQEGITLMAQQVADLV